jgi:hypothetical protein
MVSKCAYKDRLRVAAFAAQQLKDGRSQASLLAVAER